MPRFDPPHYMFEHGDETRTREAQHALVNLRGHYMGAVPGLGAAAPTARDAIRANKAKIQAAVNKVVPNLIVVNPDGTLHVNDPISAMDRNVAALFSPAIKSMIDGLPLGGPMASALKNKLKSRPVTFFLDCFDPVLDAVRGALEKVMTRGVDNTSAGFKNKTTKDIKRLNAGGFVYDLSTVPLPGLFNNAKLRKINAWTVQPGDELFDANSQRLILRLRMVLAYIVLFFKKPVELQVELLRAGLDLMFGDVVVLTSTQGRETNTPETALVVDRLPPGAQRYPYPGEAVLYELQGSDTGGRGIKTTYFRLSSKGLADRKAALQADYDRKYPAYVQDFKFWHPDFAARVGFVKSTEGKSESASVAKIAAEYDLPGRFAREQGVYQDARFRVTAGDALGGPMVVRNGPRANLKGLGSLGAGEEVVAAKTAGDVATPVAAPSLVDVILAFIVEVTKALGAVAAVIGGAAAVVVAVNKPEVEKEKTDQAQADAAARQAEAGALQTQSEVEGNKQLMLLAGGALLLAFFYMKSKKA